MNFQDIAANISSATGKPFVFDNQHSVGGGCINAAMKISGSGQSYFLKTNDANRLSMFEAEAAGLADLDASGAIKVPTPICTGSSGSQAYIVIEYLAIAGSGASSVMADFGEQLAQLHRTTQTRFGWHRNNTIGSTEQINPWTDTWLEFYAQSRLRFQTDMAARRGIGSSAVNSLHHLIERLADFFPAYEPQPSLLHGDLWSGNYGVLATGEPVIFDPATYYGDREADMAMTELFGGFGRDFYSAYQASWPLDPGYATRKTLYNLYHILNHFNMFGGGYGSQATSMVSRLLAEIR